MKIIKMQNLYIISGCNGAGKTTASYTILPEMLNCREFVNADEIAKGLSPFQPEKTAVEAGRLMLKRMGNLLNLKVDFAFETTLSSKSFSNTIVKAKQSGYYVTLLFFWLDSPDLATERVKSRVAVGGHNVPEEIIRRRYFSGIQNLFKIYMPLADYWMIMDNSECNSIIVAEGGISRNIIIRNETIYSNIKANSYGHQSGRNKSKNN